MGRKTRAARLIVVLHCPTGDVTVPARLAVGTSPGAKANIRLHSAHDVMYLTLAERVAAKRFAQIHLIASYIVS